MVGVDHQVVATARATLADVIVVDRVPVTAAWAGAAAVAVVVVRRRRRHRELEPTQQQLCGRRLQVTRWGAETCNSH